MEGEKHLLKDLWSVIYIYGDNLYKHDVHNRVCRVSIYRAKFMDFEATFSNLRS